MRRLLKPVLFLLVSATAAFGQFQITTTESTFPTGQVGNSYFTQLAASGYTGLLSWGLAGGSLPPDFVLDTSQTSTAGIICAGTQNGDGTVTCNGIALSQDHGTWSFAVVAHESGGTNTVVKQFSITVISPTAPTITSSSPLPVAVVGQPYSYVFTATGGNPPLTFIQFSSVSTFPPSFTLGSNGVLSSAGVTAADLAGGNHGIYTFTVEAVDSSNIPSTARQFSLTISQGLTINNNSPLPSGTLGVSYSQQLSASGGSGSYLWETINNSNVTLATVGLAMTSGGLIYGTPSSSVSQLQFTVEVIDVGSSSNATATKTFALSIVSSQLSIVQTTLPFALQNQPYSTALTAQGGVSPYIWSLGANSLSGLAIGSTTGILSGMVTNAPGAYSINVIVNDSAGGTNNFTFTLQVASNLSISTTSLPNATTSQSYTATVSAVGGQGPYTWSLAAGSLPPGLTLQGSTSSSVSIAGTPTSNGTYQFTIRVTDNGGRVATGALQIQVGTNISITTTSLPNGSQSITYNQILGATGGQTPYTWSISAGTLPAGLTISTNPDSTGTINGSPTGQGASQFTVQVKDAQGNTAVQTFTITIGVPLVISNVTVQNGVVGVAYSQPLGASGGTPAYTWSVVTGTLPGGVTLNSSNGLLSGTPSVAGNYSFTVQVTDSSSATAQRQYSIAIISQLTLQTGSFTGQVGTAFSQTLTAAGGVPPYTFAIQSGSLPPGISFSGSTGSFSGTPTTAGTSSVVAQVTDSSTATATANITITVSLNTPPPLTIGSIAGTAGAQPALSLTLGGTYPVTLTGTLVMTFGSSVGGGDGTVSFTDGTVTTTFTIPAGQSAATFPTAGFGVRTGTTAGSITLRVTQLTAGTTDVTPSPAPQQVIVIPKSGPVITNVTCAVVSGGFSVTVTGYSTTHDMVSGTFTFTAPSGASLSTNSLLVQLATPFQTWYASSASTATGGLFLLTQPFTGSGTTSLTGLGVTAALGNTVTGSNTLAPVTCK